MALIALMALLPLWRSLWKKRSGDRQWLLQEEGVGEEKFIDIEQRALLCPF